MTHAIEARIQELERYNPCLTAPADLDEFWEKTLADYSNKPLNGTRELVHTPMSGMNVYRTTYEGADDTPLHAWYLTPKSSNEEQFPCVVHYHGYGGSKGMPEHFAHYILMGFAVLSIDIRGQSGDTGTRLEQPYGAVKGWLTPGILDRETAYYRAITLDAIRAAEWASAQPESDPNRIFLIGGSQGGGLALIVSALSSVPKAAVAHIPNMCHMDFGILNSNSSLSEAAEFVSKHPEHLNSVLHTLSYFDNLNLAPRIKIPIMISCGLKDPCCMPETVYAAYNRIASEKEMKVYPFDGHWVSDGQNRLAMEFLARHAAFSTS
ncbi:acetylxylan esterase [Saccharibacillus kuerlensis]|uniref:Cephalosporin-C deacetylase n=1 Tax=Saccharibacillus kuerlensis TaxID=459527 RepID=A0ABQ2KS68_9BACL|nr:alpha/beta fold hydrolase [Saccharibacillus kuerlensis]GGN90811.1 cephalosporin-C deacetylase [Saccharibacillus kuerlensis]